MAHKSARLCVSANQTLLGCYPVSMICILPVFSWSQPGDQQKHGLNAGNGSPEILMLPSGSGEEGQEGSDVWLPE